MKIHMYKKRLSAALAMLVLLGTFAGAFPVGATQPQEQPQVTTQTDSYGATVTTEKSADSTVMTYSLTAGTEGSSGGYCVATGYQSKIAADCYSGAQNKPIIYRFPLFFSEELEDIDMTVKLDTGGKYSIWASVDNQTWVEIIGETTPCTWADASNKVSVNNLSGIKNTLGNAVKTALGTETADYFYIKFVNPSHSDSWVSPKLYNISLTVSYSTTWTSSESIDVNGAKVTTVTKGTDYTQMVYSMTAGKNGSDGSYCISTGSASKATDTIWCGGQGTGGVVYKIPLLFSESLTDISISAVIENSYGVDMSMDNVNWSEIIADTYNYGQKTLSIDLGSAVKTELAKQDQSSVYIRFYHETDWNAPLVHSLVINVTYSCTGSSETEVDEHGASVTTVETDKYKKVVTSFTAVTGDANYALNGEEVGFNPAKIDENASPKEYFTDWDRMVIYAYDIADPQNLEELWWEAALSQQVRLEVTTNKKISELSDLSRYTEGSEAVWTEMYRYTSKTDGENDKGLPKTKMSYNIAEYIDFDSSIDTVYVRIADAYYTNGWGGKIGGVVSATAWYDYGTEGELAVKQDTVKEVEYGEGSIDPEDWLVCRYTVKRTGEQKERSVDLSYVDIEWINTDTQKSLGSKTPTKKGSYKVIISQNDNWGLRFVVDTLTVEDFEIRCEEHRSSGYDCDENEHWLICDGCSDGASFEIEGSREPHSKEGGSWNYNGSDHWYSCKCESYDFEYGAHEMGEWQTDMLKHRKACKTCGYEPEAGLHVWDDGAVTTEPTSDAEGIKTYTCKDCGYTKTEKLDKLPESANTDTEPTTEPVEEEKRGCSSAIYIGYVLPIALASVCTARKKRKTNKLSAKTTRK